MKPVILYIISEDWYFVSHRLPLALAAIREGYRVVLLTNVSTCRQEISDHGIELVEYDISRGGLNPFKDLVTLVRIRRLVKALRPAVVHTVGLKPVLYGGIAARWSRKQKYISALAGLGFIFSSVSVKARLLRSVVSAMLRYSLGGKHSHVIVQNHDDLEIVCGRLGVGRGRVSVIQGAGVDTGKYLDSEEPSGIPVVAFVARMLKDKGLLELIEAARLLWQRGLRFKLLLAGLPDPKNPASVSQDQLRQWNREQWIDWVGNVDRVEVLWRNAVLCVLPSYREGLPKSLLEAAASGRAIVTTDTPGCRDVVVDGENGFLVPVRDVHRLAGAMERLLSDPGLRRKMGRQGRERVLRYFDQRIIVEQTLALYRRVLNQA